MAACQDHQRGLAEEASLALDAAIKPPTTLPADLETILDTLATLDNDTLLQVSHSQPTVEDGILLHALIDKRRRLGLSDAEERWLTELGERHDGVMILRAKAVALLHHRRVDLSERIARA